MELQTAKDDLGAPAAGDTPASGLYGPLATHQDALDAANKNLIANSAYINDADNPAGTLAWDLVDGNDLGQAVVDAVSDTYTAIGDSMATSTSRSQIRTFSKASMLW